MLLYPTSLSHLKIHTSQSTEEIEEGARLTTVSYVWSIICERRHTFAYANKAAS